MLYIIRGLPGSGKDTLGLALGAHVVTADQYFTNPYTLEYDFDPAYLKDAHEDCQGRTRIAMEWKVARIAVCNTFTQQWEADPYLALARIHGYKVTIIDLHDGGLSDEALGARNVHGVPVNVISRMRARYERLTL